MEEFRRETADEKEVGIHGGMRRRERRTKGERIIRAREAGGYDEEDARGCIGGRCIVILDVKGGQAPLSSIVAVKGSGEAKGGESEEQRETRSFKSQER